VVKSEIPYFDHAPVGMIPQILDARANVQDRRVAVQQIVNGLLAEGFAPWQIAILSPWSSVNPASSLAGLTSVHGKSVCGDEAGLVQWRKGECLLGETVKAFKGLEADCLVITDIPAVGSTGFDQADLYVAASRAKHRLHLVPSDHVSEAELRTYSKQTAQ
jgi:hypothetical protein